MLLCTHSKGNIHFIELEDENSLVLLSPFSIILKLIMGKKINDHLKNFLPDYCIAATQVAAFLYFPAKDDISEEKRSITLEP